MIGVLVDFWLLQVFSDWNPQNVVQHWRILLAGIIIIGFGVGLYLQPMLNVSLRGGTLCVPPLLSTASYSISCFVYYCN
nr:hypothetical protein [Ectobacillus panaciterrae]